jgi:isopentenyl-diphosphate delta-isomerase
MDVAKATALGAELSGLALPFIRAVVGDGVDGVLEVAERVRKTLESTMLLTSSRTLSELRRAPLLRSPAFDSEVHALEGAAR